MKLKLLSSLCLGAFLFSSIANAEIYKWIDAKGNVTYSSKSPPNGAKRQPIETIRSLNTTQNRTTSEPYEFKSNSSIPTTYRSASETYYRPNYRTTTPQRTPEDEALRQKIIQEASTPYKGSQNGQLTANQLRTLAAMNGVNVSSGDSYSNSDSSYSAPMPQRQPSSITNCDGAGCWGSDGTRYNRGAGDTYFPSTGGVCQGVGGQMQCN